MAPKLDPMVGRYVWTEIEGVAHRLYFEEAGQGIPLVCLHTAGADNRQFRHLLADPEVTTRFRVLAFDMGGTTAKLALVDPITAARLHTTDAQRIQRALELYRLTGQPMSALLAREVGANAFQQHDAAAPYLTIALEPSDRLVLHARIAQRFDAMLAGGLLDEVEALRRRGDLSPTLPSIRCVGYRQAWAYLDGEIDKTALREQGIAATRQLCKRQITWLRSTPERHVVDCLAPDYVDQVARLVQTSLESPSPQ